MLDTWRKLQQSMSPIALDIGRSSVTGVQLQRCSGGYRIYHWMHRDLPRQATGRAASGDRPPKQNAEQEEWAGPDRRRPPASALSSMSAANGGSPANDQGDQQGLRNDDKHASGKQESRSTDTASRDRGQRPQLPDLSGIDLPSQERFSGRSVVACLNPPDIECYPLRVPDALLQQEPGKRVAAVGHEVSRHLKSPLDTYQLDSWAMPAKRTDNPNLMVVAAPRALVDLLINWLEQQSLTCHRLDVAPLALASGLRSGIANEKENTIWGVLDIGSDNARLYIGIDDAPVYVRCIGKGGSAMTARIASELDVEWRIADQYKRRFGIGPPPNEDDICSDLDHSSLSQRQMAEIIDGCLRSVFREMSEEVKRSFQYVMELYPDREADCLYLVGGAANLPGLPARLSDMLGIPVHHPISHRLPRNLKQSNGAVDQRTSELMTALGLCLGGSLT